MSDSNKPLRYVDVRVFTSNAYLQRLLLTLIASRLESTLVTLFFEENITAGRFMTMTLTMSFSVLAMWGARSSW